MSDECHELWYFEFTLEANPDSGQSTVSREQADALLDLIIEAAEAAGLQIGGGYSPPQTGD